MDPRRDDSRLEHGVHRRDRRQRRAPGPPEPSEPRSPARSGSSRPISSSSLRWCSSAARSRDRFGRRRIFSIGTVIFAGASLACGLAPGVGQIILARAVQGAARHFWFRRASRSSALPSRPRNAAAPSGPGPRSRRDDGDRPGPRRMARRGRLVARRVPRQPPAGRRRRRNPLRKSSETRNPSSRRPRSGGRGPRDGGLRRPRLRSDRGAGPGLGHPARGAPIAAGSSSSPRSSPRDRSASRWSRSSFFRNRTFMAVNLLTLFCMRRCAAVFLPAVRPDPGVRLLAGEGGAALPAPGRPLSVLPGAPGCWPTASAPVSR